MTSQAFNLNIIPQGVNPIIHVSQYDKGQTWIFTLYEGDIPYNVPSGSTVTIQGTKKDGTGFQYPCTYTDNTVTAIETDQMTLFCGKYPCEISITNNDQIIGSLNFIIDVEQAPLGDDTVISETDLPLLIEALELAPDAEAWAVGTRGGVPVSSSDPTFENNAKYYAEHFAGYIPDAMYDDIQTILS